MSDVALRFQSRLAAGDGLRPATDLSPARRLPAPRMRVEGRHRTGGEEPHRPPPCVHGASLRVSTLHRGDSCGRREEARRRGAQDPKQAADGTGQQEATERLVKDTERAWMRHVRQRHRAALALHSLSPRLERGCPCFNKHHRREFPSSARPIAPTSMLPYALDLLSSRCLRQATVTHSSTPSNRFDPSKSSACAAD